MMTTDPHTSAPETAKHTPKPWKKHSRGPRYPHSYLIGPDGAEFLIASVHNLGSPELDDQVTANANLIVMAPELLEALVSREKRVSELNQLMSRFLEPDGMGESDFISEVLALFDNGESAGETRQAKAILEKIEV